MKHALATLVMLSAFITAAADIGDEMPLPGYGMTAVSGRQVSYNDVKGKSGTVVTFWCNHCPYVVKWRSRFVDIAKEYQDRGIGFLAVNSNDPQVVPGDDLAGMKKDADQYGYTFAYTVDEGSRLAKALGGERTPHVFVFDASDKLVYIGAIDDSADPDRVQKKYLRQVLDALIADEPLPVTRTKAFGCSIKWYK